MRARPRSGADRAGLGLTLFLVLSVLGPGASAAPDVPDVRDATPGPLVAPFSPLAQVPETEPNDTFSIADSLRCGDALQPATISPNGDEDYVVFTAVAGDAIVVGTGANGVSGQLEDTVVSLYDAAQNSLGSDDDSGPGRYSLLQYTVTVTGTYYARIAAFDPTATGAYRAFVLCSPLPIAPCALAAYDSVLADLPEPRAIPDGNPTGITLDPLATPNDGQFLRDVVLGLRIEHSFVGDLTATLTYDVECDGTPEASARVLCRPGRTGCENGNDAGCPANASCSATLFLGDLATQEIGGLPWQCGSTDFVLPSGCYQPSASGEPFSTFARLPRGGCFRLTLADWVPFESGTVCGWRVYMAASPTGVRPVSWSNVKQLFR